MADFISGSLLVPGKDLRINQGAGRIGHCHGLGQNLCGGLRLVRQSQNPIRRNAQRLRAFRHQIGIWQPRIGADKNLRQGRAICSGLPRQARLRVTAEVHRGLQARSKEG